MTFPSIRPPTTDASAADKVYPLRLWDSNAILQKLALDFTLCFDDVLNPEKFNRSLQHLVTIGNWHQIGARLKKNVCAKLYNGEGITWIPLLTFTVGEVKN